MLDFKQPAVMFHQTFTFRRGATTPREAKRRLNRALGTLHRRFKMVSVYVTEDKGTAAALHYHVVFLFFAGDVQPCRDKDLREVFGRAAFEAWNSANGGTLNRNANRITVQQLDYKSLKYLTKEVQIVEGPRPGTNWSGARPKTLIARHSKGLSRKQLNREVRLNFDRLFGAQLFLETKGRISSWNPELFGAYKKYHSAQWDWDFWKLWVTGHQGPISDRDLFEFLRSDRKNRPWSKPDSEVL